MRTSKGVLQTFPENLLLHPMFLLTLFLLLLTARRDIIQTVVSVTFKYYEPR